MNKQQINKKQKRHQTLKMTIKHISRSFSKPALNHPTSDHLTHSWALIRDDPRTHTYTHTRTSTFIHPQPVLCPPHLLLLFLCLHLHLLSERRKQAGGQAGKLQRELLVSMAATLTPVLRESPQQTQLCDITAIKTLCLFQLHFLLKLENPLRRWRVGGGGRERGRGRERKRGRPGWRCCSLFS